MNENLEINSAGLKIIKDSEGFYPDAYLCPAHVPTIGYGSTIGADGGPVRLGQTITEEDAEKLLKRDIAGASSRIKVYVQVPLSENQFSALVSFVYNVGSGNFKSSTLLAKLNKKDYHGAAAEFAKWVRGGGKVLPGLVTRRAKESQLFLED